MVHQLENRMGWKKRGGGKVTSIARFFGMATGALGFGHSRTETQPLAFVRTETVRECEEEAERERAQAVEFVLRRALIPT
jgi:hypothetical protein